MIFSLHRELYSAVQSLYNHTIRPYLPRDWATLNEVEAPATRILDFGGDNPEYEKALICALTDVVEPGDDVVIVGGGLGVTAVRAFRAGATVTVFEAGDVRVGLARRTVAREGAEPKIDVQHAIVGDAVAVEGETSASVVSPSSLPSADVLELDCEGAELEILEGLNQRPRAIVVETHENLGAPPEAVENQLMELGYTITAHRVDEADAETTVMTAEYNNDVS